jgi:hypothetical protein
MKRVNFILFFTVLFVGIATSQNFVIKGTLRETEKGLALPEVKIKSGEFETISNSKGDFKLEVSTKLPSVIIVFLRDGFKTLEKEVKLRQNSVNLGLINLTPQEGVEKDQITGEDRIPTITLSNDDSESELGNQNISGILSASRDPFVAAAAFNLSSGGFNIRGYEFESVVFFNGIPVNNLENGAVYWSVWGGLNDVTRNRESTIDLSPVDYTFGGIGGASAFDTRASEQRVQRRVSYMFSNRAYAHRLMGTWTTGMQKNGWAYSFSASKRWANEGYIPGTFYDAYSYFASIDKKLSKNHLLNFTALGAPVRRGQQGAGTEEVNELAGSKFYNPNWGYQNGEKRNARVVEAHQPLLVLRHDWKLSNDARLTTAAGYQFGKYGRSGLDWFNAPDPRPDYYRNLPSYLALDSKEEAEKLRQTFLSNPDLLQINWQRIYEANAQNGQSYQNQPGLWSQYVVAEQRSDTKKTNFSAAYTNVIAEILTVNFGINHQQEKTHYFNRLQDLLGGDYYVNLDRFAIDEGAPPQFNLENQDVIVREGDTYGWDYDINSKQYGTWLQGQLSSRKFDIFLAAEFSKLDFWRTGHFRNARFQDSSYGDSEKQNYSNGSFKGGLTFKIDGRNYIYSQAAYFHRPPDPRNAFASSRNRDQLVPGLSNEKVRSVEAGYLMRWPGIKARLSGYITQFEDGLKINRFFLPGDISNFGTYILTGLDREHKGLEFAFTAKLSTTLTANGAAAYGKYVYTSRPNGIFIQDDDGLIRDRGTIFIKNFFVPGSPQTAGSLGVDYRSPKFWSASITVNYFDRNYIDFSPERRTADQVFGLSQDSEIYNTIVRQTKADQAFTVDLFGNKSFRINNQTFLYITAGITNLLNATVVTGGYEQLRFERNDFEEKGINVFPPRYFYAYGTNFFVMAALRF